MPNHLQSRTDDMHKGPVRKRAFGLSALIILATFGAVVATILGLT